MALADEIDYPSRGDDAVKTMLIGGALVLAPSVLSFVAVLLIFTFILAPVGLLLLPFALVPQLLTQGYLVRVLDDTLDGGVEPPQWRDWSGIAVDGLKFLAVSIAYSVPIFLGFLVVGAIALAGTSIGAGIGGDGGGALAGLSVVLTLVLSLVFVVLALAVGYLLPVGVCAWVHDDSLGGAFDVDRIRAVATTREYAVAWGAGVLTLLVGGGVAQVLFFLLVGFPLLFAAQVLAFRFFARGYADALDLDVAPTGATPAAAGTEAAATSVPDPDPLATDTLGAERPEQTDDETPAGGPASERDAVEGGGPERLSVDEGPGAAADAEPSETGEDESSEDGEEESEDTADDEEPGAAGDEESRDAAEETPVDDEELEDATDESTDGSDTRDRD
jgi:hypothetical protein